MTSIPNDRLIEILEKFYSVYTNPTHQNTKEHIVEMTDFLLSIDGYTIENLPEIDLISKEFDTERFILDFKKYVPFKNSQLRIVRSFIQQKMNTL